MHAIAGDRAQLHELLDATLRLQENGLPPVLWEALLDEVDCLPKFLRVCLIMFNLHKTVCMSMSFWDSGMPWIVM